MFSSDIPDDWVPPPEPEIGSKRWLDKMAYTFVVETCNGLPDRSVIFKLPDVTTGGQRYKMGYFVVYKNTAGYYYFRTENIETLTPKVKYE